MNLAAQTKTITAVRSSIKRTTQAQKTCNTSIRSEVLGSHSVFLQKLSRRTLIGRATHNCSTPINSLPIKSKGLWRRRRITVSQKKTKPLSHRFLCSELTTTLSSKETAIARRNARLFHRDKSNSTGSTRMISPSKWARKQHLISEQVHHRPRRQRIQIPFRSFRSTRNNSLSSRDKTEWFTRFR